MLNSPEILVTGSCDWNRPKGGLGNVFVGRPGSWEGDGNSGEIGLVWRNFPQFVTDIFIFCHEKNRNYTL